MKSKIKAGLYKTIDCGEVAIIPPSKITMITWASKKNNDLRGLGAYNLMKLAKSIESTIFHKEQENNQRFNEQLILFNKAMIALIKELKS